MRPCSPSLRTAILLALIGCGGGSATDSTGGTLAASLRLTGSSSATDTALAVVSPLVAEVRVASAPRSGVAVRFDVLPTTPSGQNVAEQVRVATVGTQSFATSVIVMTDAAGMARVQVRLGNIVGDARVAVSCPELAVADTARLHIEPGQTARVVTSLRDTVLFAGASFRIQAFAADQSGNPTEERVSFEAGPNVLSVDDSGRVRTAAVDGRGVVRLSTVGSIRDSVRFRTIAIGRVLLVDYSTDAYGVLTIADLDGANRRILRSNFAVAATYANLSPAGDAVVFQEGQIGRYNAMYMGSNRITRSLVDPTVLESSHAPRFSRDGKLVYLSGRPTFTAPTTIWRVRVDGGGLEQITQGSAASSPHTMPTSSPDGTRVAYVDASGLQLMTLATGSVTKLGPPRVQAPEFSPDGRRIAYYLDDTIVLVNTDGSRSVTVASDVPMTERPSWLPNSSWLLIRTRHDVQIVDVETSERMLLPWLSQSWQIVSAP